MKFRVASFIFTAVISSLSYAENVWHSSFTFNRSIPSEILQTPKVEVRSLRHFGHRQFMVLKDGSTAFSGYFSPVLRDKAELDELDLKSFLVVLDQAIGLTRTGELVDLRKSQFVDSHAILPPVTTGVEDFVNNGQIAHARMANGTLKSWDPRSGNELTTFGTLAQEVVQVAVPTSRTSSAVLLADGTIRVSPNNDLAPSGTFTKIIAADRDFLGLSTDGEVVLFGAESANSWLTVPAEAKSGIRDVAASSHSAAALKEDGEIITWGYYSNDIATTPEGGPFDSISHSRAQVLGTTSAGVTHFPKNSSYWGPTLMSPDVVDISISGQSGAALLSDGSITSWSDNGRVDDQSSVFEPVPDIEGAPAQLESGYIENFLITDQGNLYSWGTKDSRWPEIPEAARTDIVDFSASHSKAIALNDEGAVITWSWGGHGALNLPHEIEFPSSPIQSVKASSHGFFAINEDHELFAWGGNFPTPTSVLREVKHLAVSRFVQTAAVLKNDGSIVVWNYYRTKEIAPTEGKTVKDIAVTPGSLFILFDDGSYRVLNVVLNSTEYRSAAPFTARGPIESVKATGYGFLVKGPVVQTRVSGLALSANEVLESAPLGTLVGSLSVEQPSEASGVTYAFAEGSGSEGNALFSLVGSELRVNGVFDHETSASISVRLSATDESGNEEQRVFTIAVADDRNEDFDDDGLSEADEEDTYGSSDLLVDTDGDGYSDPVEVAAGTSLTDFADNPNTAPTDIALSSVAVAENGPAGVLVGTLSATDPDVGSDSGESLRFSLVEESENNDLFYLAGDNLDKLYVSQSVDFEDTPTLTARVVAFDRFNNHFEKDLIIAVTDDRSEDTDRDGLTQAEEEDTHGTSDLSLDSDGDGFYDPEELAAGTDPTSNTSFPMVDNSGSEGDWVEVQGLRSGAAALSIAHGNGVFVSASQTALHYSMDGAQWQLADPDTPSGFRDVTFANGRFVAVGFRVAAVSTNGARWVPIDFGEPAIFAGAVAANDDIYVIAATDEVITSLDGLTWTRQPASIGSPQRMFWEDGLFHLQSTRSGSSGFERVLFTSPDGVTWTEISAAVPDINGLIYDGITSRYYAVGRNETIYSSEDGATWTTRNTASGSFAGSYTFITKTTSGFLAGGQKIMESTDGLTWTVERSFQPTRPNDAVHVGNTTYFAGGSSAFLRREPDGEYAITHVDLDDFTVRAFEMAKVDNDLVTGGAAGLLAVSKDGGHWEFPDSGTIESIFGLAHGEGVTIAVASDRIVRSTDLEVWTEAYEPGFRRIYEAIWDGAQFIVLGLNADFEARILTSPDGNMWSEIIPDEDLESIAKEGSIYYATSRGRKLLSSGDLITWAQVPEASGVSLQRVTSADGKVVAAGGTTAVVRLTNGTWQTVNNVIPGGYTTPGRVGWTGSEFFYTASSFSGSTISTSPDGVTWSNVRTGRFIMSSAARRDSGELVVSGSNIASSGDLSLWKAETGTVSLPFTLRPVITDAGVWAFDGERSFFTDDLTTWAEAASPRPVSGTSSGAFFQDNGVIWENGQFTGVYRFDVWRSTNGVDWARLGRLSNSSTAEFYNITSNGSLYVATGFSGGIARSTSGNANSWTVVTPLAGASYDHVTAQGGKFFAFATVGGVKKIVVSTNGATWETVEVPLDDVLFDGTKFIGVGADVYTSPDGLLWTQEDDDGANGTSMASLGNEIVIAGATSGQVFSSTNGRDWEAFEVAIPAANRVRVFEDAYVIGTGTTRFFYRRNELRENAIPTDLIIDAQVSENLPSETVVGRLTAIDPDEGERFLFSFATGEGADDNAKFRIGGARFDQIITQESFDFESQPQLKIRLKVADSLGAAFEKAFVLNVINDLSEDTDGDGLTEAQETESYATSDQDTDSDDDRVPDDVEVAAGTDPTDPTSAPYFPPQTLAFTSSRIAENVSPGESLGEFIIGDPDVGESFTLALVDAPEGEDFAKVSISGQQLIAEVTTDHEVDSFLSLLVDVTDKDGLTTRFNLDLPVIDDRNEDADGDGLTEAEEEGIYGTSDLDADSDDDGWSDGDEAELRTSPTDAEDNLTENVGLEFVATLQAPTDRPWDRFGADIAITDSAVFVSAPFDGADIVNESDLLGAVYHSSTRNGGLVRKLAPTSGTVGERFGEALAANEEILIVGAPGKRVSSSIRDDGAAYIFDIETGSQLMRLDHPQARATDDQAFGTAVAIGGGFIAVGDPSHSNGSAQGAVYIYDRTDMAAPARILIAPSSPAGISQFGRKIAIAGDRIAVAAAVPGSSGDVYVFELSDLSYVGALADAETPATSLFGSDLEAFGARFIVGSANASFTGTERGAAGVFNSLSLARENSLRPISTQREAAFGKNVALTQHFALVASEGSDSSREGWVRLFDRRTSRNLISLPRPSGNGVFGDGLAMSPRYLAVGTVARGVELYRIINTEPRSAAAIAETLGFEKDLSSAFAADANGDGVDNGLAYALGIPLAEALSTENREKLPRIESEGSSTSFAFDLPTSIPDDVVYCIEELGANGVWIEISRRTPSGQWIGQQNVSEDPSVGVERRVSLNLNPSNSQTVRLYRLRVEASTE